MIDSKLATKLVNKQLEGVLDSLEQDQLSPEEAKMLVQDEIKELLEPLLKFKERIDFEDENDLPDDFNIARKAVMITLDRSLKLSDLAFHALAVDKTNTIYLQLAQDINKTVQQATKTLSDLHTSYQRIIGQKKKNDLLKDENSENVDNVPEGVATSPFELLNVNTEK